MTGYGSNKIEKCQKQISSHYLAKKTERSIHHISSQFTKDIKLNDASASNINVVFELWKLLVVSNNCHRICFFYQKYHMISFTVHSHMHNPTSQNHNIFPILQYHWNQHKSARKYKCGTNFTISYHLPIHSDTISFTLFYFWPSVVIKWI